MTLISAAESLLKRLTSRHRGLCVSAESDRAGSRKPPPNVTPVLSPRTDILGRLVLLLGRFVIRSVLAPGILAPALLAACAHNALRASEVAAGGHDPTCSTRVIVIFTENQGAVPSPELVTGIARESAMQLTFIRAIGPGLYVFSLTAADSDPSCAQALMRLRQNPRIRSVDVDARRRPLG